MLTHFQYKPLYPDTQLPGWELSFYFGRQQYQAIYHKDGTIEYTGASPGPEQEKQLADMIHELMIYHVYDK